MKFNFKIASIEINFEDDNLSLKFSLQELSTGIKIESNQEDINIWFLIKTLEVIDTIQDHAITFWNQKAKD